MTAAATRVLVDLSHAADGYVGIAQDVRLIFAMLCGLPGVTPSGLLMPAGRHDLGPLRPGMKDEAAMVASVLHAMERNWAGPERLPFPFGVLKRARSLRQLVRTGHALLRLPEGGPRDALWRVLFAKTLAAAQRAQVLAPDFYATDLSVSAAIDRIVHLPVPVPKRLAADGFDAVLFAMPRPVTLPPGVRQILRFHDAVPVTDPDTVQSVKMALAHSRLVRACAPDAVFVCNSPQSLRTLLAIDPTRERHAVVIPCAIAPSTGDAHGLDIAAIMQRHVTFRAIGPEIVSPPPGWTAPAPGMRYVLSVSTLEPRKNFPGLIRGWERVSHDDPGLRLVIVGGAGWREEEVLAQMRPGVEGGRILHLQNLPPDELRAVMAGAACFAFPSFSEGFGFTPLEAMQAGAPCVVSDISVFRWIFGGAALYVDPYDPNSIADGIRRIMSAAAPDRANVDCILERFRPATVAGVWADLLAPLRAIA